jgi:hypothetical protein
MFNQYDDAYHAAGDGNLIAMKNCLEKQGVDPYFHRHMCTAAIHGGNPKVLEYIINWGEIYGYVFRYDSSDELMDFAIRNLVKIEGGHLLAYMHQTRILSSQEHESFMKRVCEIVVEECNPYMIRFLDEMHYDCPFKDEDTLIAAIKTDNFDMINYWINHNSRLWSLSDEEYANLLDRNQRFAQLVHKHLAVNALEFHIHRHFKGESKRAYARKTLLEFGIDP